MQRYKVTVVPPGVEKLQLLVPFSSTSTVSALAEEVKKRIIRLDIWHDVGDITLHLEQADGPILDEIDLLLDVVPYPEVETIFATARLSKVTEDHGEVDQQPQIMPILSAPVADDQDSVKIHVVTPALARLHTDIRTVPPITVGSITGNTTLRSLETQIRQHLGLATQSETSVRDGGECNCSFARVINDRGLLNEQNNEEKASNSTLKFVVVYGRNNVVCLETEVATQPSILQVVHAKLGEVISNKIIIAIGGVLKPGTTDTYSNLPVLSICSKSRHANSKKAMLDNDATILEGQDDTPLGSRAEKLLDLHTSEAPIEMSAVNMDLTINQLGLADNAVNGVLNIYAVERKVSDDKEIEGMGMDAIFKVGAAWEHPIPQSERGMAMLLSALRVFTELISARHMEHPSQDAVLHVFNLLTRFPPAVRAMYILMSGKSLRDCETAALAQAIYEVVKDIVPGQLIKSDGGRIFEGSRLLFGLILDKAQHLKLVESDRSPYISSMSVLDLRNTFTMEPIVNPIQTSFGLVEKGYYEAMKESGLLRRTDGTPALFALPLTARIRRLALLCGGLISQVTIFDLDSLNSSSRYADGGDVERVIAARELSDIHHLAVLCSRTKLGVLPPSTLPSAEAPALTLDRDGLLAVYVGRPPCAEPGKDIAIFRPTRGGEENVDVSIITQVLIPILEQRDADGTAVFDSFGDQERKFRAPDEIIMLCVDCSASMGDPSDFVEIKDEETDSNDSETDEDEDGQGESANKDTDSNYPVATLDDMKSSISEHESFSDMLCIVHNTMNHYRRTVAGKILEILSSLASQQLLESQTNLVTLKQRNTSAWYRTRAADCESVIKKSKTFIDGLSSHKEAICDFLIYRAANSGVFDDVLTWTTGQPIPKVPKPVSEPTSNTLSDEELSIPSEFICSISQEVLEDPVITCDGFTFERNAIERWFQIRRSSPLTGLPLENTSLRFNGKIANDIKNWVEASDILHPAQSGTSVAAPPRRLSFSSSTLTIQFFSRLGSFSRRVPKTLTVGDLYRIAFRGMKGRHTKFELHSKNVYLSPSQTPVRSTNIRSGSVIHINIAETPTAASVDNDSSSKTANTEYVEMCLIKVYESYDQAFFSYWVPRTTTKSLGSILFQYWRHKFKNGPWHNPTDLIVWTGLSNKGDNHIVGHTQHHWSALSKFLDQQNATGKLRDEKVYYEEPHIFTYLDSASGTADELASPPLVLKVWLGSKPTSNSGKGHRPGRNLSRLDVLKQMFDAFINRLLAYNFKAHIGLITFQSTVRVTQNITHAIENFRHEVNNMEGQGDTALWDAIALANDQLVQYSQKFPGAKKRIICLSDGQDTKSQRRSHDVSWTLLENKVVLDSFCLGGADNVDLRTMSYLSGGYKFKPNSLEQAMAICEMEPVLSQLERPAIAPPSNAYAHSYDKLLRFVWAKDKAKPEIVTRDVFPKRKEHPNINDRFVELAHLIRLPPESSNGSNGESSVVRAPIVARSDSNLRTARILTEIRNIIANPHPHYDVYVSESNMAFWKVVMQGPPQSAYTEGNFVLYLDMEENYPAFPPKGRFSTPIYHPNINRHGRICHSILDRNWTSDTTILQVLNAVYSLLLVPEFSDPINAVVTLDFHWDEVAFQNEAREHIHKHALKTRAEWRAELLGY